MIAEDFRPVRSQLRETQEPFDADKRLGEKCGLGQSGSRIEGSWLRRGLRREGLLHLASTRGDQERSAALAVAASFEIHSKVDPKRRLRERRTIARRI